MMSINPYGWISSRLHLPHFPRLRGLVYPLLCLLSLALLPYQPDNDPVTAAAQIAQEVMSTAGMNGGGAAR